MNAPAAAISTQQLAEFLAVLSDVPDSVAATRVAVECAAHALEAEVAVIIGPDGVLASVGVPRNQVPAAELIQVAVTRRPRLEVPGAGLCYTAMAPLEGVLTGRLLVARAGPDGFTVDEISLLRGMARVLELTVGRLHTLDAERRQATENERLLAELRERHRLLQELSKILRTITRREPFQSVLDAITGGAQELLGDEVAALRLRDPDDPDMLLLHASRGLEPALAKELWRLSVAEAGAAGLAVARDELVVLDPYPVTGPLAGRFLAAMAAPVHDNGAVAGALVVSSFRPRHYTDRDREMLRVFAEHVSLAVSDHKTREKMYEAYHDSLTGLASRALFLERLEHGIAQAARRRTRLAVLFIDLDRFKTVNDSLGHSSGDALLIGVAERLRTCLRAGDTAARLGGDEFVVFAHDMEKDEQAHALARRIIDTLEAPFVVQGREVFVGASIGIAFNAGGHETGEQLIRGADLAMYQAKKNGKGRHETYHPGMHTLLLQTLDLETHLRRAVERNEFVLQFQPIVELADGRINSLEALIRWRHPEQGIVPPLTFVPLAEETGLIVPIGLWVLREACQRASGWNATRSATTQLTVSVNLSARQLQQPDLPALVAEVLQDTGLDPACLVLEITESLLLSEAETTPARLRQLKALGLRLAIDDFGTGYSSPAYLRRFPIDIIKIDKSFVDEVAEDPEAAALSRAIVELGRTLRLSTVAEGIEDPAQLSALRDFGCRLGQGYHFAKPLDPDELEIVLQNPCLP